MDRSSRLAASRWENLNKLDFFFPLSGYLFFSLWINVPWFFRKDSWAGPSWTCPTGTPSRHPCPTSVQNMDGRPRGSAPAETRRSSGLMRLSLTLMCWPPQRSSPANTSLVWCRPLCLSHLRLNACSSTRWMEAAEPSMTQSRKTCRGLACVWTPSMMSFGGK